MPKVTQPEVRRVGIGRHVTLKCTPPAALPKPDVSMHGFVRVFHRRGKIFIAIIFSVFIGRFQFRLFFLKGYSRVRLKVSDFTQI